MIETLAQLADDITEVTDTEGETWARDPDRPGWWRSNAHKCGVSSQGLVAMFSPLTPVTEPRIAGPVDTVTTQTAPSAPVCTEPDCPTPVPDHPDNLCGGQPDGGGQGCGQPFCDWHLYVTAHDGNLCSGDYNNIDHYGTDY